MRHAPIVVVMELRHTIFHRLQLHAAQIASDADLARLDHAFIFRERSLRKADCLFANMFPDRIWQRDQLRQFKQLPGQKCDLLINGHNMADEANQIIRIGDEQIWKDVRMPVDVGCFFGEPANGAGLVRAGKWRNGSYVDVLVGFPLMRRGRAESRAQKRIPMNEVQVVAFQDIFYQQLPVALVQYLFLVEWRVNGNFHFFERRRNVIGFGGLGVETDEDQSSGLDGREFGKGFVRYAVLVCKGGQVKLSPGVIAPPVKTATEMTITLAKRVDDVAAMKADIGEGFDAIGCSPHSDDFLSDRKTSIAILLREVGGGADEQSLCKK